LIRLPVSRSRALKNAGCDGVVELYQNNESDALRADVYATAAITRSAVMVIVLRLKVPRTLAASAGGVVYFVLRGVSFWQHWNLPKVTGP
jgi:uncharacterized membrane protein YeiH